MERVMQLIRQYRYGVLVLLVGLGLMLLPTDDETKVQSETVQMEKIPTSQDALEGILGQIEGAGKVKVLLTQSAGETTIYQQDFNQSGDTLRQETVVISDADRVDNGLVKQVIPPEYLGAIIVCEGGDRAAIRLAIVDAVSNVTGLTADKISVLKMK